VTERRQGIYCGASKSDFEVEVWSSGVAGRPDAADQVTDADSLADTDLDAGEVRVQGLCLVCVVDDDEVAPAAGEKAGPADAAGGGCCDGRAAGGGEVDAAVESEAAGSEG
jgi:hypothetical protein